MRPTLFYAIIAIGGVSAMADTLTAQTLSPADACRPSPFDTTIVTAFVNVTLIDGTGTPPRPGTTVVFRNQRIEAIFPTGSHALHAGTRTIDLTGRYLIPGLIDTHTHVATDPAGEDTRERTERRLCNALLGGVTTIREMAGDVRALSSLARDALVGAIVSPDIHYVALFASPAFFADPRGDGDQTVRRTERQRSSLGGGRGAQTGPACLVASLRGTGGTAGGGRGGHRRSVACVTPGLCVGS